MKDEWGWPEPSAWEPPIGEPRLDPPSGPEEPEPEEHHEQGCPGAREGLCICELLEGDLAAMAAEEFLQAKREMDV